MKARALLEALRSFPIVDPLQLTSGQPFVVLSPHPDDESLGCGGLIAAACDIGQPVEVVVLTDGAGSHPKSKAYPAERLVRLRKAEAAAAAGHLGLPETCLTHLDLPDAHAPIEGPCFLAAVDTLETHILCCRAASLFVTWGLDPHCDHEAADRMARALRLRRPALRLWSYPIWSWHLEPDTDVDVPPPSGYRIDIAAWQTVKRAAIAAYESQMTGLIADDPDGFRFEEPMLAPFLGPFEYFIEVPA